MPIFVAQAKYTVRYSEKLPATGGFVVTPNHYSNYDPLIVGVILFRLGRVPRFMAKASLWKVPVLRGILRSTGQVPVDRTGRTRGSDPVGAGAAAIARGEGVIVYPEGSLTREPDLWPMRGKTGAVRLALEAGVPLIPMAQWGAQTIMPRYGKGFSLFPRKRIRAAFGDPVDLSAYRGRSLTQSELLEATEKVMQAITGLLQELRDGTPPAVRYDPAQHNQSEIGRFEPEK
ncbi:lysophospholipid acyltransferase family protein [Frondihabitans australicus]|uniref:1-acyl-sn-glycerol-3-phosphate acyltransferase n=1 Tax=Frondihabitans australicus TaxID=386892 RepID=A0A495ICB0_9MICO|nr:lysophospholipid acyltransferase family protein [Frondihabitans australicus]RKR73644.1 1-acyl-sn-glycerol-3-phosphate acyltransferase [Frondihabitans australicus]